MITDILDFRRDPLGTITDGMRQATALVWFRFGPFRAALANRSEDIEHVLVKNHENYEKGRNYEPLKLSVGDGLITSEGELWRQQRKLVQPAFHHKSLAGFADTMTRCTNDLLARWATDNVTRCDVHEEMMRLTFRIVGLTLFSYEVESTADEVGRSLEWVLDWTRTRSDAFVRWPLWVPTPGNLRYKRHRKVFDDLIFAIIRDRKERGLGKGDLLDMLMSTDMSEQLLRDEAITLAVAGHETTANALSWTFLLLSQHPEIERKVHQEVKQVLGERTNLTLADLPRLELTERVLKESMRLYPPVWAFERRAIREDEIAGQRIGPGTFVMIVPYSLHRDPFYWDNPEGFDPDRFLPEREKDRPRFAYIPFGGGPRVCIGNAFAMMEAKIVLATILSRHRVELVPGHRILPAPYISLRPKHGVQVTLHHRS